MPQHRQDAEPVQDSDALQPPIAAKPDRIDENLAVIRFDLYPRYLELLVEGSGFPPQFWCRLGGWTGKLRRRVGVSTLENEGRVLYTVILDLPLDVADPAVFPMDGQLPASFDLRRGDREGRHPKGWTDSVSLKSETPIVASEPKFSGGDLTGWALNGTNPDSCVFVRLIERCVGEDGSLQEVPLESVTANHPSTEGQDWHGVSNTGFRLSLPEAVFDGKEHELALQAWAGDKSVYLWSQDFVATDEIMRQRLSGCQNSGELFDTLMLLTWGGRFGMLASYFDRPQAFSSEALKRGDEFSVLGQGLLLGVSVNVDASQEIALATLERRFRAVCREMDESQWLAASVDLANRVLGSSANDLSLGRYPHAPLVEAACDLAVVATTEAADRNTVLTLASLCMSSGRYLLARDLLQSLIDRETKQALPLVRMASVEISLANLDSAEARLHEALQRRAKFPEALNQMARLYVKRGQYLEAAAVLSGGRGLGRWVEKPPPYRASKYLAALDWRGVNEEIALASGNQGYLEHLRRADDVLGPPPDPRTEGFSLIFMDKAQRDLGATFGDLSPLGCAQVVNQNGTTMDQIEGMGRWSIFLRHAKTHMFQSEIVAALFAQMRCFEPVMELQTAKMDERGLPVGFQTVGLVARNDTLRLFGGRTLEEFAELVRSRLATKTVLV